MKYLRICCLFVLFSFLMVTIASCGGKSTQTVTFVPSPTTASPFPILTPTDTPSPTITANWDTYHRDLSRSGFDSTVIVPDSLQLLWNSEPLDGDVYSEPLIIGGEVLVSTEQDSVYSFDANTGKLRWHVKLGSPVPLSNLSCGDIDPSGITSTPVADPVTGRLYVVARIQQNSHELFALDIEKGSIIFHRLVDPPGANPKIQQQRAALALANGRVYIAFGGLYGDCGPYHGWLVGVNADGSGQLIVYRVPADRGASIWATSGPAVDAEGNVYVATGNGFSNTSFDFGNSILRLSPELNLQDWFAPSNWQELNRSDMDLGSLGPILLQDNLIFQAGKEGKGYLLNSDNLGHIGGEVFSGSLGGSAFGGASYAPPYIFVPTDNGLVALKMQVGPSFSVAWRGPNFVSGSPVVAGDVVCTVDTDSGVLYIFSLDKGDVLFKMLLGNVARFTTPTLSGGRIFIVANNQLMAFGSR